MLDEIVKVLEEKLRDMSIEELHAFLRLVNHPRMRLILLDKIYKRICYLENQLFEPGNV